MNSTIKLSDAGLDEKGSKELCFWCDEKFVPGHKCPKQLTHRDFMMTWFSEFLVPLLRKRVLNGRDYVVWKTEDWK